MRLIPVHGGPGQGGPGQRGFALVLALWATAALAATGGILLNLLQDNARERSVGVALVQCRIAADSAIAIVAARLRDPSSPPFEEMAFALGDIDVSIHISPEAERTDLNAAGPEPLQELFVETLEIEPEEAAALADAVVDWRDSNDLRQLSGAEDDDYRRAGLDYGAADRPFRSVAELRHVLGMTPEYFRVVAPHLTVTSGSAAVSLDEESDEGEGGETDGTPPAGESGTPGPDDGNGNDSAASQPGVQADEAGGAGIDDQGQEDDASAVADPGNIYRLVIETRLPGDGGATFSAMAVIWTEPPASDRNFEILDFQSFYLPVGST